MGSLKNVTPAEMGATVLKAALEEANVKPDQVSEVIIGNVISAGLGQNIARHISLDAGIPQSVPAHAINMVCGSGLEAVIEAAIRVQAGWGDIFVAGGVENMSAAPYLISGKNRQGVKMGNQTVVDSMVNDGLTDAMNNIHMGVTAENIAKNITSPAKCRTNLHWLPRKKPSKQSLMANSKMKLFQSKSKKEKKTVVFDTDEHQDRPAWNS